MSEFTKVKLNGIDIDVKDLTARDLIERNRDSIDDLSEDINGVHTSIRLLSESLTDEIGVLSDNIASANNRSIANSNEIERLDTYRSAMNDRITLNEIRINELEDEQNVQDSLISVIAGSNHSNSEAINVLTARMDEFTSLDDGSTSGDAELQDIRVGANGVTYDSAGTSVRTQIDILRKSFLDGIPFLRATSTYNGVTFTWDGSKYVLNGTSSGSTQNPLIRQSNIFPAVAGSKLLLDYETSNSDVWFSIVWFFADNTSRIDNYSVSGIRIIDVPLNAVRWSVRLFVSAGKNVSGAIVSTSSLYCLDTGFDYLNKTMRKVVGNTNLYNIINNIGFFKPQSKYGITLSQNDDGSFKISGVSTSEVTSQFDLYYNRTQFLEGIKPNTKYLVVGNSNTYAIRIISYTGANDNGTVLLNSSGSPVKQFIDIPSNATGITIRLQKSGGFAVDTPVYEDNIVVDILEYTPTLNGIIGGNHSNSKTKMWSLGNSFMNSAVWENNSLSHFAGYDDSIYGVVANMLNIPQENNNHELHSSTGLFASGTDGSFYDIITSSSLTDYDYLFTQFNGTDITIRPLGNVDSPAGENSIAGGIASLCNYIKTNNGLCKLIIMSVPPYASAPSLSGNNVFTGNWSAGYSINDLDNLMYQLAKKYHFIYVSWQDLEISYHYMDYADFVTGNTGPRHAKYDKVYRALGEYVGMQIFAVNSPIAMSKL